MFMRVDAEEMWLHVFIIILFMFSQSNSVWSVLLFGQFLVNFLNGRVSVRFPTTITRTFLVSPSVTARPAYHALPHFILLTVLFDLSKSQNSLVWKLILLLWVVCYVQVNTRMRKLEQIMYWTQLPTNSPTGMEIIELLCS